MDNKLTRRAPGLGLPLVLEYDPKPPFSAGSPEPAGPELVQDVLRRRAKVLDQARIVAADAGRGLAK